MLSIFSTEADTLLKRMLCDTADETMSKGINVTVLRTAVFDGRRLRTWIFGSTAGRLFWTNWDLQTIMQMVSSFLRMVRCDES